MKFLSIILFFAFNISLLAQAEFTTFLTLDIQKLQEQEEFKKALEKTELWSNLELMNKVQDFSNSVTILKVASDVKGARLELTKNLFCLRFKSDKLSLSFLAKLKDEAVQKKLKFSFESKADIFLLKGVGKRDFFLKFSGSDLFVSDREILLNRAETALKNRGSLQEGALLNIAGNYKSDIRAAMTRRRNPSFDDLDTLNIDVFVSEGALLKGRLLCRNSQSMMKLTFWMKFGPALWSSLYPSFKLKENFILETKDKQIDFSMKLSKIELAELLKII